MANEKLQSAGLRSTNRREAILAVLEKSSIPMAADEIYEKAAEIESMGISTAYRLLSQMTDKGLLIKNDGGDGRSYYQLATSHMHKHTLHCTACGCVVPIEGCPLAALEEDLCARTGFEITGHSLAFTGLCPKCKTGHETAHKNSCGPGCGHNHDDE